MALDYAKTWSRYAKELLAWTEKRANYGEDPLQPSPGAPGTVPETAAGPRALPCLPPPPPAQSWSLPEVS